MFRRLSRPLEAALLLILALASPAGLAARTPPAGEPVIAITHATILTVTNGDIANGTVLIRDGKIAAVGRNVTVPSGAEVIDATGRFVSPGIIDATRTSRTTRSTRAARRVSSMTGIEDVLDPTDIDIYRDLAGGVTTANVLHGSANPIGGKNAVIKLRWGKTHAEDLDLRGRDAGHQVRARREPEGHAAVRPARARGAIRATRMGVEYVIRDAFTRAKAYQKAWKDYDARRRPPSSVAAAAPRSAARAARRSARGQAARARALLPRRRDPDADPARRRDGLQGRDASSTCSRATRSRRRSPRTARAPRRSRTGGATRWRPSDAIPYNAAHHDAQAASSSRSTPTAPEHARRLNTEAAKIDEVRRPHRGRGAGDGDDQPGEAAAHRQARRLDRGRQGRRRRHLESPSAQQLRASPIASTSTARSTTTGRKKTSASRI